MARRAQRKYPALTDAQARRAAKIALQVEADLIAMIERNQIGRIRGT